MPELKHILIIHLHVLYIVLKLLNEAIYRVGNSFFAFLSESIVFCEQKRERAIHSRANHLCSTFSKSDKRDLLTSLFLKSDESDWLTTAFFKEWRE